MNFVHKNRYMVGIYVMCFCLYLVPYFGELGKVGSGEIDGYGITNGKVRAEEIKDEIYIHVLIIFINILL
jgi:hypothetical protein